MYYDSQAFVIASILHRAYWLIWFKFSYSAAAAAFDLLICLDVLVFTD